MEKEITNGEVELATFAGGCFWCTEAIFQNLKGVLSVVPGYAGSGNERPSYYKVASGTTDFTEAIQIKFDPSIIPYEELVDVFFKTHDPTTLNRQGADVGPQYRSAIFFHSEDQKKIALEVKAQIEQEKIYSNPIVTEIVSFINFYEAEAEHRNFYNNNKSMPYCQIVIDPKLAKFRKEFSERIKD